MSDTRFRIVTAGMTSVAVVLVWGLVGTTAPDAPRGEVLHLKGDAAVDLWQKYEGHNDAAVDEQFLGKRVRLSGRLESVKTVTYGANRSRSYLLVMTCVDTRPPEPKSPRRLEFAFQFPADSRKELAALVPERHITVEGVCAGRVAEAGNRITFEESEIIVLPPP